MKPIVELQLQGHSDLHCQLCCLQSPAVRAGDQTIKNEPPAQQSLHHGMGPLPSPRGKRPFRMVQTLNARLSNAMPDQNEIKPVRVGHAEEE